MNHVIEKFQQNSAYKFYKTFSPASRATILVILPFVVVDAFHYYTAGTALIFSLPLLFLAYLFCGWLAAAMAIGDGQDWQRLPRVGCSAAVRLWLTSTIINTILSVAIVGILSLGSTLLSAAVYLCLAPLHALGSALAGWLGGWLYQQYAKRIKAAQQAGRG